MTFMRFSLPNNEIFNNTKHLPLRLPSNESLNLGKVYTRIGSYNVMSFMIPEAAQKYKLFLLKKK